MWTLDCMELSPSERPRSGDLLMQNFSKILDPDSITTPCRNFGVSLTLLLLKIPRSISIVELPSSNREDMQVRALSQRCWMGPTHPHNNRSMSCGWMMKFWVDLSVWWHGSHVVGVLEKCGWVDIQSFREGCMGRCQMWGIDIHESKHLEVLIGFFCCRGEDVRCRALKPKHPESLEANCYWKGQI